VGPVPGIADIAALGVGAAAQAVGPVVEDAGVGAYIWTAIKQVGRGDFTPDSERNLAGTVGEVVVGIAPIAGTIASGRDLTENIINWKWTWGHVLKAGGNVLGLVPLFKGPIKAARALNAVGDAAQGAGKLEKLAVAAAGKSDDLEDLAKGLDRLADGGKGVGSAAKSGLTNTTRLTADELATGQRLEAQLGKPLKESPHEGAEFVDELGQAYDALGVPGASKFWNEKQFLNSIDKHLLKSDNITVIDLTGFTPAQVAAVNRHLATLTAEQLARIIKMGF
jgi:hypothetical protein